MVEKVYKNGKRKQLRGIHSVEANLWRVSQVTLVNTSGLTSRGDPLMTWTAILYTGLNQGYMVDFRSKEDAWDYVSRLTLEGVPLRVWGESKAHIISPKNKGKYPWQTP